VLFLSTLRELLQPSAKILLAFLQDAPVIVTILAFFIAWIGCWLPLATILAVKFGWRINQPLEPEQKIPLLVSLYVLAPLIIWGVSQLKSGSFADYGIKDWSIFTSLPLGFGLGVSSLAIVFFGESWLGWCCWSRPNMQRIPAILLPISLVALFVGGIEELVFRGFIFTTLEQDYPIWSAILISSLIFALLHLVWEQKETKPQLPGLVLMGLVLTLARFVDGGSLGIAWGLHSGWIWAIALMDTAELHTYTGKVSEWITGKNKKPLAGLAGIICVLATGVSLWLFFSPVITN